MPFGLDCHHVSTESVPREYPLHVVRYVAYKGLRGRGPRSGTNNEMQLENDIVRPEVRKLLFNTVHVTIMLNRV